MAAGRCGRGRWLRRAARLGHSLVAAAAALHLLLVIVHAASDPVSKQQLDEYAALLEKLKVTTSAPVAGDPCYSFTGAGGQVHKVSSPNYPLVYPPNTDCIHVIEAPMHFAISLQFVGQFFQIEPPYVSGDVSPAIHANLGGDTSGMISVEGRRDTCPADFFEIRDGRYGFSPLIGRFCGLTFPTRSIRANSGFMWLHFHSDGLLEYHGFQAEYRFEPRAGAGSLPGSGSVSGSQSGTRTSHDCQFSPPDRADGFISTDIMKAFYKYYSNGSDAIECVWKITVDEDMQIRLFMHEFTLGRPNECALNFMEIYAGSTAGAPMKRYCGMNAGHVRTGWPTAYVRIYATKEALAGVKIRALYSAYAAVKNCSEAGLFSCDDDTCIPESLVCNTRSNCVYEKDEHNCGQPESSGPKIALHGPYLIILVVICSIIMCIVACALVLNCCPACRRRQEQYDKLLRQQAQIGGHSGMSLAGGHNSAVTGFTTSGVPGLDGAADDSDYAATALASEQLQRQRQLHPSRSMGAHLLHQHQQLTPIPGTGGLLSQPDPVPDALQQRYYPPVVLAAQRQRPGHQNAQLQQQYGHGVGLDEALGKAGALAAIGSPRGELLAERESLLPPGVDSGHSVVTSGHSQCASHDVLRQGHYLCAPGVDQDPDDPLEGGWEMRQMGGVRRDVDRDRFDGQLRQIRHPDEAQHQGYAPDYSRGHLGRGASTGSDDWLPPPPHHTGSGHLLPERGQPDRDRAPVASRLALHNYVCGTAGSSSSSHIGGPSVGPSGASGKLPGPGRKHQVKARPRQLQAPPLRRHPVQLATGGQQSQLPNGMLPSGSGGPTALQQQQHWPAVLTTASTSSTGSSTSPMASLLDGPQQWCSEPVSLAALAAAYQAEMESEQLQRWNGSAAEQRDKRRCDSETPPPALQRRQNHAPSQPPATLPKPKPKFESGTAAADRVRTAPQTGDNYKEYVTRI